MAQSFNVTVIPPNNDGTLIISISMELLEQPPLSKMEPTQSETGLEEIWSNLSLQEKKTSTGLISQPPKLILAECGCCLIADDRFNQATTKAYSG